MKHRHITLWLAVVCALSLTSCCEIASRLGMKKCADADPPPTAETTPAESARPSP